MVRRSGGHVCTVLLVQVMNAACTARPAVIVVPNTSEDVAAVVRAASSSGLELSVRSGGHSYTCTNLKEGGVHVDMRSARSCRSFRVHQFSRQYCDDYTKFGQCFKLSIYIIIKNIYKSNQATACFNVEIGTLVHRPFTKRTRRHFGFYHLDIKILKS